jgi:phosphocarrier protein FPr/phosphocarrier protein
MIEIASPLSGWVTPLEQVPDPVFTDRMLGDGTAVDPVEGRLVAPGDGAVSSVHAAGHAVTLALDSGPVLLIHIGLDTVALGGNGFSPAVKDGQRVAKGETLIHFDLDLLARRARSLVTPVIVTNGDAFRIASRAAEGPVDAGAPLLMLEPVAVPAVPVSAAQPTALRSLRLLLAHGLHARPAARLSKLARLARDDPRRRPAGRGRHRSACRAARDGHGRAAASDTGARDHAAGRASRTGKGASRHFCSTGDGAGSRVAAQPK